MKPEEIAADLRTRAFDLVLAPDDDPPSKPYGFINEFRQGPAIVTLAAFKTGDASLYFSTGGGILGGIGQPELATAAKDIIAELEPLLPQLTRTDAMDPPTEGEFCFYVLTRRGRFAIRAKATDTVPRNGAIVKLVRLGGQLLTKFRELSESGKDNSAATRPGA